MPSLFRVRLPVLCVGLAPVNDPEENAGALLRETGVRRTPVREAVLGALLGAGAPLSQKDLAAIPGLERVNKVTLYRTLDILANAGVAHRVIGIDGEWRFCSHAPAGGRCTGNHPHFLCLNCGRMACLRDQTMPRVRVPEGYAIEGKQLIVYGACPECREAGIGR